MQHTAWHWSKDINGKRLDYWPSKDKFMYDGVVRQGGLREFLKKMEARGANASLAECYRAVTGGTGEPGNWHGARPVVNEIADLRAKLEAAERDAERYRWLRENRLWLKANLPMLAAQEFDAGIDSAMRDYYAARGGERG